MFNAEFISIAGCLSYANVRILHQEDYSAYEIIPHFEERSVFFICEGQMIEVHQFNINLIKLDSISRVSGPQFEIVVGDDLRYPNSYIIPKEEWVKKGIPILFNDLNHWGQFVFSDIEGTYWTLDSTILMISCRKCSRPMKTQVTKQPKILIHKSMNANITKIATNHRNRQ